MKIIISFIVALIVAGFFNIPTYAQVTNEVLTQKESTKPPTINDLMNIYKQQRDISKNWSENAAAIANTRRDPRLAYGEYEFDQYAKNFDRFKNSPCYSKLGFDPQMAMKDPDRIENEYKTCEQEFYANRNTAVYTIAIIVIMICFIIYKFSKMRK